jgi:ATP-dependent DNA helicase RecQ
MEDQVSNLVQRQILAGFVDANSSKEVEKNVMMGYYSVVYMSPELMITKWRNLFASEIYQKRLKGIIIDEAHCIVKW